MDFKDGKIIKRMMEMNLEIKNISKQYNKKCVLDKVSQNFTKGVYGLLGPNGAGKTTLLNIIATVIATSEGEIDFNGKNVYDQLEEYHSVIGYLPQRIGFYNHFTGYDLMKYMYHLKGGDVKDTSQIDTLLKRVNLYSVKDNRIATYSGGMKQRLGVAQAFLGTPTILLLDEPTVGLDLEERAAFKKMIREAGKHAIVILSTHIVSDVEEAADYILIMNEGKVLENNEMKYYKERIEQNGLDGLEQYYLLLTGRRLYDSEN